MSSISQCPPCIDDTLPVTLANTHSFEYLRAVTRKNVKCRTRTDFGVERLNVWFKVIGERNGELFDLRRNQLQNAASVVATFELCAQGGERVNEAAHQFLSSHLPRPDSICRICCESTGLVQNEPR